MAARRHRRGHVDGRLVDVPQSIGVTRWLANFFLWICVALMVR
jgi:hypothetical protein